MEIQIFLTSFTRYVNITLSILCLIFWIYLYIKYKQPGAVAPILWLINLSLFYIYVFSISKDKITEDIIENLNIWAASIHMMATILLITAAGLFCSYKKAKRNKNYSNIEKV